MYIAAAEKPQVYRFAMHGEMAAAFLRGMKISSRAGHLALKT
jgi:hypothetical protein